MKNSLTTIALLLISLLTLAQKQKLYTEIPETKYSVPDAKIVVFWNRDAETNRAWDNKESVSWFKTINYDNDTAETFLVGEEFTFEDNGRKIKFTSDVGDIEFYYTEKQKEFVRTTHLKGNILGNNSIRTYGARYKLKDGTEITIRDSDVVRSDMSKWNVLSGITVKKGKNVVRYEVILMVVHDRTDWSKYVAK
jgi:hypothetical protein